MASQVTTHLPIWRRLAAVTLTAGTVAAAWQYTPLADALDLRVARPLEFAGRAAAGRAPAWSDRLVVIGYDGRAADLTGRSEPDAGEWAAVLDLIGSASPRAVLIDKVFRHPPPGDAPAVEQLAATIARLGNVRTGLAARRTPEPGRTVYAGKSGAARLAGSGAADGGWYLYGAHPVVESALAGSGHLHYLPGALFLPVLSASNGLQVPHFSAGVAEGSGIDAGRLFLDGVKVPTDHKGRAVINLHTQAAYQGKVITMTGLLERARRGIRTVDYIPAGSVVLILPLLVTGNAEFDATPVGEIPRGFALASAVNSALTGGWLRPAPMPWLNGYLAAGAAAAAASLGGAMGWLAIALAALVWPVAGLLGFAGADLVLSWLTPFAVASLVGPALRVWRVQSELAVARRLTDSLSTMVPKRTLEVLKRDPDRLRREPAEQLVTVMFVDIAGFSAFAEERTPKVVFERLRTELGGLSALVHAHGGVIDKTLGDGLLAIFGYDPAGGIPEGNHAEHAVRCAMAIQRARAEARLAGGDHGEPALPVRIGIHTAQVYLGDLGGTDRFDFTLIGAGVNFAQRLEAACERDAVLLSLVTHAMLPPPLQRAPGMSRRHIAIKHQRDLVEAVHLDALLEHPDLRAALAARQGAGTVDRRDVRFPVAAPAGVRLRTPVGAAMLRDFSASGFSFVADRALAPGVTFALSVEVPDSALAGLVPSAELAEVTAVVRWSRPAGEGGFVHGASFAHLPMPMRVALFRQLRVLGGYESQGGSRAA